MSRREIARKFDEIVDVLRREKFIDTPVKRYSSGMYVRLAFAVAAHLEPEILIVDEVLAVGDAEFQRALPGADGGAPAIRPHGALRLAQHAGDRAALRPRDPPARGRSFGGRPERRGRRALPPAGDRAPSRGAWPDLERARAAIGSLREVRVVDEGGS